MTRWVAFVARHGWAVLSVLGVVTAVLAWVAVDRFRMNSNLSDLILQDAPWRVDFDRYEAEFPDLVKTAVVVVSGNEFKQVEDATSAFEAALKSRPEHFRAVYAGRNHRFFRDHALLYLDEDDLDDMADRLAEAQPMLTVVAEDPSLRGILDLVADGIANEPPAGFDTIVRLLTESAEAVLAGRDPTVLWTNEFFTSDDTIFQLILLKSNSRSGETVANAEVMAELRLIIDELALPDEVRVGVTGEVALAHEEIEAAIAGVRIAGWLAVVLLAVVLIVGVRSAKIIVATFTMLIVGTVWTSAYAMLTVGEYNTLSIVFLVMFFGLSVDFAIHFSLRYQEAVNAGTDSVVDALASTTFSVGGAIAVCSVTTALGFLGFWPTDYAGLADLGVISAGGMLIAGFLTFTLLPAFYSICGPIRHHVMDIPSSERLVNWLIQRRGIVMGLIVTLAVAAGLVASQSRFDYSVLALKDPDAGSMRTLRLLQEEGLATDYALAILTDEHFDTAPLEALTVVDSVISPWDFVPQDQDAKLFVLEDLQQLLESALEPLRTLDMPTPSALAASVANLQATIDEHDEAGRFRALRTALDGLATGSPQRLVIWQRGIVSNLVDELEWLRRAVDVEPFGFEDLPVEVTERLVSDSGRYLSIVLPAEDVAPVAALSRFIESVRSLSPFATGRPVIEWGVGRIVIESFQQALAFAALSIGVVLLIVFHSLRFTALILIPLALAVLFTLAAGVWFDSPLNMANILVLPLIFGLGVDNGIHVVDRYRGEGGVANLMHSSTPRAVLLSTLTTVGTFTALSLSPHAGTASIGLLLTVAVSLLLLFTVFLLPVLLSFFLSEQT
ncbi:MAG: MMPL family transporter [Gammaproteobacteria bacterium]|nr:MMPL family transporter [Gammaproteobacteria bacterium]